MGVTQENYLYVVSHTDIKILYINNFVDFWALSRLNFDLTI